MPICGYLVYPAPGKSGKLRRTLETIAGCEVRPAENRDLLVLVTDTPDEEHEQALQEKLKSIPSIQCLALSFAHGEEGLETGGHCP